MFRPSLEIKYLKTIVLEYYMSGTIIRGTPKTPKLGW
jgi:hypothetical protein